VPIIIPEDARSGPADSGSDDMLAFESMYLEVADDLDVQRSVFYRRCDEHDFVAERIFCRLRPFLTPTNILEIDAYMKKKSRRSWADPLNSSAVADFVFEDYNMHHVVT